MPPPEGMTTIGFSERGPALFQMANNSGILTSFPFNEYYPHTLDLIRLYVRYLMPAMKNDGGKQAYFEWLQVQGEMGRLSLDKLSNTRGECKMPLHFSRLRTTLRNPSPCDMFPSWQDSRRRSPTTLCSKP